MGSGYAKKTVCVDCPKYNGAASGAVCVGELNFGYGDW